MQAAFAVAVSEETQAMLPALRSLSTHVWNIIRRPTAVLAFILVLSLTSQNSHAYSVLTHEQVVDLLWKDRIAPMLLERFPRATDEDLRKAHAFAYGGSLIQDMGYYPFGNRFFSDLTHYVRSGDFVVALINDSTDLNEYAFALGALSHYVSDNSGHPTINRVVAIEFPKLKKKYGDIVTYGDDPKAHIRTEFGFDMTQVAHNRYTSDRYHDFIGFEVSKPVLERAFYETYGLQVSDVFGDEDLAIGTFRRSISTIIPEMTRVALLARKKEMVKEDPNFDRKKFLFYLSRTNYEKQWGKGYRRPGFGARVLAFFLKIIPKVGPFAALDFKIPTTQTEDMYIKSVNLTVEDYHSTLKQADGHALRLINTDCDTGRKTSPGEYRLSDATYAKLLDKLSEHNFNNVPAELRANILEYFSVPNAPLSIRTDKNEWARVQKQLDQLRSAPGALQDAGHHPQAKTESSVKE